MYDWQETEISRKAKEIRANMIGGAIYGVPITSEDIDAMIVAAYHMGRSDELKLSNPKLFDMLFMVRNE